MVLSYLSLVLSLSGAYSACARLVLDYLVTMVAFVLVTRALTAHYSPDSFVPGRCRSVIVCERASATQADRRRTACQYTLAMIETNETMPIDLLEDCSCRWDRTRGSFNFEHPGHFSWARHRSFSRARVFIILVQRKTIEKTNTRRLSDDMQSFRRLHFLARFSSSSSQ